MGEPQPATRAPVLLLLKGHPGTGKSTLAQALARTLGWTIADKDDAKNCLVTLETSSGGSANINDLSYDIMFRVAATQLAVRNSVIIDCPLARQALYACACDLARQHGAAALVVECVMSDAGLWRHRLEARAVQDAGSERSHKPGSWQALQQIIGSYQGADRWSETLQPGERLVVDGSQGSTDVHVAAVLAFLSEGGAANPHYRHHALAVYCHGAIDHHL